MSDKKWFFEGELSASSRPTRERAPTLLYFWDGAQRFVEQARKDPRLKDVIDEIFVCGSAGRMNPTPNDIDILVFGKKITEADTKELFRLRCEADEWIMGRLKEKMPDYANSYRRSYIDLEVNNQKKRKFIEKNDPMSLKRL